jgi:predicted RNA-binding protein with RPS1 domain
MASDLPNEGDILEGTVVRVETYGAFCRLGNDGGAGHSSSAARRGLQGLIHISQLVADQRVERVEDVVSVDDRVWVKVLKVEMDPNTQRWRIQLSRRDVSQDGMATDLGLERQTREHQRDQLETNLNSMIGMGVARDPMADRLVMKNAGIGTTFRGGYSLVGDDEGEPELPPAPAPAAAAAAEPSTPRLAPMGRGRGTTLPAWMTQASDGPTGGGRDEASESEQSGDDIKKREKKRERKHSKSHKKRDRKDSSGKGRKRKRRRERDGSDSDSSPRNEDDRSDASRDRRKRIKNDKRKTISREHRTRHRDDDRSESRDRRRRRRSESRSGNR